MEDGARYRDILCGLVERTRDPSRRAEYEAALRCPPLPASLAYLWTIFNRIRRRKRHNGFSMPPIEWPDIDAFLRNTRITLAPWEIEIIEELDDLFLMDRSSIGKD